MEALAGALVLVNLEQLLVARSQAQHVRALGLDGKRPTLPQVDVVGDREHLAAVTGYKGGGYNSRATIAVLGR